MPYFELGLNKEPHVTIGGGNLDILTFGLISGPVSKTAYLQVTSMKKATAEHEMLLGRQLTRGDILEIVFRRTESSASAVDTIKEDAPEIQALDDNNSERLRRTCFSIKFDNKGRIDARADDDSTLHVAATWIKSKNQCLFEIACIRMTNEGQNQLLLEYEIEYDHPLFIQVC